ncbi:nuclease-related domain-containing protein [Cohnella herbarum]|uniref:NERD domain-containing protein n=1 Tax=Cohnella herbarum TaxID=2728023 RepID=A0A7Z2VNR7_9BACL|nr:nuclease-related domain-containing protein [Cohnella herbarum]QJD86357.1 NERD domain-containing protein [Cohnella herbarum]
MFAKIIFQNGKIKKQFHKVMSLSREHLSPLEKEKIRQNIRKGNRGEFRAALGLWLFLPRNHYLINDVVIEVTPNNFIQIDHLVISPWGIFIVETKNWEGTYDTHQEMWTTGSLKKISNDPVKQLDRTEELLKQWLTDNDLDLQGGQISRVYMLYKAKIGQSNNPNAVTSSMKAAKKIVNDGNNIQLDVIKRLIELIKNVKPLNHWDWIRQNGQVSDMRYFTFKGSKRKLNLVKQAYENKGYQLGDEVHKDDEWIVEVVNHIELLESALEKRRNKAYSEERRLNWKHNAKRLTIIAIIFTLIGAIYLNRSNLINYYSVAETSVNEFVERNKESSVPSSNLENSSSQRSSEPLLSFKVTEKQTYIMIRDQGKRVISDVFPADSSISIFDDKTVKVKETNKPLKTIKLKDDIIDFEVANSYTEVIYNSGNINKNRIDGKFDFVNQSVLSKTD